MIVPVRCSPGVRIADWLSKEWFEQGGVMQHMYGAAAVLLLLVAACTRPDNEAGASAAEPSPWTASGNEPGWRLTIDGEQLTLTWNYGQDEAVMPRPEPSSSPDGRTYHSSNNAHDLRVDVTDALCHDTMSGMPYPEQVSVDIDSQALSGCGGSPGSLLRGAEWVVEDIAGAGIVDRSRATLNFGDDGRLTGQASCNTYGANWKLSGEGLTVDKAQATLMACSRALDNQEREFLRLLATVQRFDITDDGALLLHSADGATITARRE